MRMPPNSAEAERAVLGAVFIENACVDDVTAVLREEDWYQDRHRAIFRALLANQKAGAPIDVLTVSDALKSDGKLESVGGLSYLNTLLDAVPTSANVAHYVAQVVEHSQRRRVVAVAREFEARALEGADAASDLVARMEQQVRVIADRACVNGPEEAATITTALFAEIERRSSAGGSLAGPSVGIQELDDILGGLQAGKLYVIGARPGMGKTALAEAMQWAGIQSTGTAGVFFSLEMTKAEVVGRVVSMESGVDGYRLMLGRLRPNEWDRVSAAALRVSSAPFIVDDTEGLTALEIRARTRRIAAGRKIGSVVVDYLQLMKSIEKADRRDIEIGQTTRALKGMAKELGVPVLLLSQLNRKSEERADKRPQLSDLRESGDIEADADVVIFIHRPGFRSKDPIERMQAEIIIEKHRGGRTGSVAIRFIEELTKFESAGGAL